MFKFEIFKRKILKDICAEWIYLIFLLQAAEHTGKQSAD